MISTGLHLGTGRLWLAPRLVGKQTVPELPRTRGLSRQKRTGPYYSHNKCVVKSHSSDMASNESDFDLAKCVGLPPISSLLPIHCISSLPKHHMGKGIYGSKRNLEQSHEGCEFEAICTVGRRSPRNLGTMFQEPAILTTLIWDSPGCQHRVNVQRGGTSAAPCSRSHGKDLLRMFGLSQQPTFWEGRHMDVSCEMKIVVSILRPIIHCGSSSLWDAVASLKNHSLHAVIALLRYCKVWYSWGSSLGNSPLSAIHTSFSVPFSYK